MAITKFYPSQVVNLYGSWEQIHAGSLTEILDYGYELASLRDTAGVNHTNHVKCTELFAPQIGDWFLAMSIIDRDVYINPGTYPTIDIYYQNIYDVTFNFSVVLSSYGVELGRHDFSATAYQEGFNTIVLSEFAIEQLNYYGWGSLELRILSQPTYVQTLSHSEHVRIAAVVMSVDEDEESLFPPNTPTNLSPVDNYVASDLNVTFSGRVSDQEQKNSVGLRVEYSQDSAFSTVTMIESELNTNGASVSVSASGLESGAWFWRAKSYDNAGLESSWSEVRRFTIPNRMYYQETSNAELSTGTLTNVETLGNQLRLLDKKDGAITSGMLEVVPNGGTYTGKNGYYIPFQTFYHDNRFQYVLLSSELINTLTPGQNITKIAFKPSELPGMDLSNFRIRLQNTTSSTSNAWVSVGWTDVYGPTTVSRSNFVVNQWIEFTFTAPFQWNGDNLLVDVSRDGTGYTQGGGMYVYDYLTNRGGGSYTDSSYTWPYSGSAFSQHSMILATQLDGSVRLPNYHTSGNKIIGPIELTDIGQVKSSIISWTKSSSPPTTNVIVEKSLDDGGIWTTINSGDPLAPVDTDVSKSNLQLRVNLSTTDTTQTPYLDDITIEAFGIDAGPYGKATAGATVNAVPDFIRVPKTFEAYGAMSTDSSVSGNPLITKSTPFLSNRSPANNATVTNDSNTLSATFADPSGSVLTVEFQVDDNLSFTSPSTLTVNNVVPGVAATRTTNTYMTVGNNYWRVRATNAHGNVSAWSSPWGLFYDPGSATSRVSPDSMLAQTNLTGSVTVIQDDPDTPNASWLTATSELNTQARVSFYSPPRTLVTGANQQNFRVLMRSSNASGGTGTGSATIHLYENGVSRTSQTFTLQPNSTGTVFQLSWDASLLSDTSGSNVEVFVEGIGSYSGKGTTRWMAEIGAAEWNATMVTPTKVNAPAGIAVSAYGSLSGRSIVSGKPQSSLGFKAHSVYGTLHATSTMTGKPAVIMQHKAYAEINGTATAQSEPIVESTATVHTAKGTLSVTSSVSISTSPLHGIAGVFILDSEQVVYQNSQTGFDSKVISYQDSFVAADSKTSSYQDSFATSDSRQVVYEDTAFVVEHKQSMYQDTSLSTDSKQVLFQDGQTANDSKQLHYQDGTFGTESKQVIYQNASVTGDSKQTICQDSSQSADSKQSMYEDITREIDSKQTIYQDSAITADNLQDFYENLSFVNDIKQVMYEDNLFVNDSKQVVYENSMFSTDSEQVVYDDNTREIDSKQVVYQDTSQELDSKQLMYESLAQTIDSKQSFYQDQSIVIDNLQSFYESLSFASDIKQIVYEDNVFVNDSKQVVYENAVFFTDSKQVMYEDNARAIESKQTIYQDTFGQIDFKQSMYQDNLFVNDSKQVVYQDTNFIVDSKQLAYEESSQAIDNKQSIYQDTSGRMDSKQSMYQDGNVVQDQHQLFFEDTIFVIDSKQVIIEDGQVRLDIKAVIYQDTVLDFDTFVEIYQNGVIGITHNDFKVIFYEDSSKVADSKQMVFQDIAQVIDNKQTIYQDGSIVADNNQLWFEDLAQIIDSKQSIYQDSSIVADNNQLWFEDLAQMIDSKQTIYQDSSIAADNNQLWFEDLAQMIDSKQTIYQDSAIAADNKQLWFQDLAQIIDSKQSIYQDGSTVADNKQLWFQELMATLDSKQTIFQDDTRTTDSKQAIYQDSSATTDSKQLLYQNSSSVFDNKFVLYHDDKVLPDTIFASYEDAISLLDSEQSIYQDTFYRNDSRQLWYEIALTRNDVKQLLFHDTSVVGDSEQAVYQNGVLDFDTEMEMYKDGQSAPGEDDPDVLVRNDIRIIIYQNASATWDSKQSMYQTGISQSDIKQSIYENNLTNIDSKQTLYHDTIFVNDSRQSIYQDNNDKLDSRQSLYQDDSAQNDVRQSMHQNGSMQHDSKLILFSDQNTNGDTRNVIYQDAVSQMDSKQSLYEALSFNGDTKQFRYENGLWRFDSKQTVFQDTFSRNDSKFQMHGDYTEKMDSKQLYYEGLSIKGDFKQLLYENSFGQVDSRQTIYEDRFSRMDLKHLMYDDLFVQLDSKQLLYQDHLQSFDALFELFDNGSNQTPFDVFVSIYADESNEMDSKISFFEESVTTAELSQLLYENGLVNGDTRFVLYSDAFVRNDGKFSIYSDSSETQEMVLVLYDERNIIVSTIRLRGVVALDANMQAGQTGDIVLKGSYATGTALRGIQSAEAVLKGVSKT